MATVNISGEDSKSGVPPADVPALARAVAALPQLNLRGLMAIPEPAADFAAQRVPHRALRLLMDELRGQGIALDTLSMATCPVRRKLMKSLGSITAARLERLTVSSRMRPGNARSPTGPTFRPKLR